MTAFLESVYSKSLALPTAWCIYYPVVLLSTTGFFIAFFLVRVWLEFPFPRSPSFLHNASLFMPHLYFSCSCPSLFEHTSFFFVSFFCSLILPCLQRFFQLFPFPVSFCLPIPVLYFQVFLQLDLFFFFFLHQLFIHMFPHCPCPVPLLRIVFPPLHGLFFLFLLMPPLYRFVHVFSIVFVSLVVLLSSIPCFSSFFSSISSSGVSSSSFLFVHRCFSKTLSCVCLCIPQLRSACPSMRRVFRSRY